MRLRGPRPESWKTCSEIVIPLILVWSPWAKDVDSVNPCFLRHTLIFLKCLINRVMTNTRKHHSVQASHQRQRTDTCMSPHITCHPVEQCNWPSTTDSTRRLGSTRRILSSVAAFPSCSALHCGGWGHHLSVDTRDWGVAVLGLLNDSSPAQSYFVGSWSFCEANP